MIVSPLSGPLQNVTNHTVQYLSFNILQIFQSSFVVFVLQWYLVGTWEEKCGLWTFGKEWRDCIGIYYLK